MKKKILIQAGIFVILLSTIIFFNVKYIFLWPVLGDSFKKPGENTAFSSNTKRYVQTEYVIHDSINEYEGIPTPVKKLSPEVLIRICNAYLRFDEDPQFGFDAFPKEALYRIPFSTKYLYLRSRDGKITRSKGIVIDERNGKIHSTFYLKY